MRREGVVWRGVIELERVRGIRCAGVKEEKMWEEERREIYTQG